MYIKFQCEINTFLNMDTAPNISVDDILHQLETTATDNTQPQLPRQTIDKNDLEDFVIQKSGALVEGTLEMIDNVKDYIRSAPESRDVSSLAELINAASSAIETLNKIVVSNKKNETSIKIKEMDISTKKELHSAEDSRRISLTREEIFKMLFKEAKPIEGQIIENKQLNAN